MNQSNKPNHKELVYEVAKLIYEKVKKSGVKSVNVSLNYVNNLL